MTRGDRLNLILHAEVGSAITKAVLFVLDNYIGDSMTCWPSRETIATKANCSADSVDRAIKSLRDEGIVIVTKRGNGNAQTSNLYRIDYQRLKATQPPIAAPVAANSGPPQPQAAAPPAANSGGGSRTQRPDPLIEPPNEPLSVNREPPTTNRPTIFRKNLAGSETVYTPEFKAAWDLWPSDANPAKSARAWQEVVSALVVGGMARSAAVDRLMGAIRAFAGSDWAARGVCYSLDNWLLGDNWQSDPSTWAVKREKETENGQPGAERLKRLAAKREAKA